MAPYSLSIKASTGKEFEAVKLEKLAGYDGRYRLRQGNYRVVYEIDDNARQISIYKIGHRGDVYR